MTCYRLAGIAPEIAENAYVAREATVIGKVRLGDKVSIRCNGLSTGWRDTSRRWLYQDFIPWLEHC